MLLDKLITWLDQLALDIRVKTKASISRAEIIRAVLAAVEERGLDLSQAKSEGEAKEKILNLLKS